jgi:hypothetical protein
MSDYSTYTDEELAALAGGGEDKSIEQYTDEELMQFVSDEPQQPFTPIEDVSTPEMIGRKARAGLAGAADMALFGMADEAKAGFQGLVHGVADNFYRGEGVPNLTVDQARQMYLEKARAEADQLREESPVMYHGGQFAGAIAAPMAAPKAVTKGIANFATKGLPQKYIAGSGLGAGAGSLYGAGSADEGERGQGALIGGGIGALGGAGGVAVTDLAKAAAKPITSRISAAIARKKAAKEMLAGNTPLISRANVPTDMNMQSGKMLDLTEGQLGQDAQRQSLEIGALKGGYGKEAQDLALSARATQQAQMRSALGELGADTADAGQDALEASAKVLKGSYKDIKAQVNKAYEDARIIQGVYINQSPIDEVFKPQVNAILRGRGFPIEDFSDRSKRIINQLQDSGFYEGKKVTKTNLEKMEFWRRRATNAMNDANSPTSQIKEEGAALGQIISAYDDFMAKMPKHALMSGDEEALEAIDTARGLRRKQGVLFERNKVVKDIVQNNDLTNEELANMLITGSKQGEVVNKGAGRVLKGVKRGIPPEKQAAFTQNLKRGTMSRVLEKSLGTTRDGDYLEIMPNKLIKELKMLDKNNTFMNELFDEPERVGIKALIDDLELINSVKQGADNYSNSAYTLMRWLDKAPFGGFGITSSASKLIAEPMAESGARKTLKQSLSPVIKQYADGLKGAATYYGGATGGLATTGYNKEELQ